MHNLLNSLNQNIKKINLLTLNMHRFFISKFIQKLYFIIHF